MKTKKDTNTEKIILEAANRIFQKKGMEGARMQEIANEAGINKAMLHYYFRSKELLFDAVFNNVFSLLYPQIHEILNSDDSLENKVHKFCNEHITFLIQYPYLPNFIFQELHRNPEFIYKLKENDNFPKLDKFNEQVEMEVAKGNIVPINGEQIFINLLSLNIFPFVASHLLKAIINLNDKEFENLMKQRKIETAEFILNSIKRKKSN